MTPEEEKLKEFKILVGLFHEQMHSNSVTDLISWLDCKIKLDREMRESEMKESRAVKPRK